MTIATARNGVRGRSWERVDEALTHDYNNSWKVSVKLKWEGVGGHSSEWSTARNGPQLGMVHEAEVGREWMRL